MRVSSHASPASRLRALSLLHDVIRYHPANNSTRPRHRHRHVKHATDSHRTQRLDEPKLSQQDPRERRNLGADIALSRASQPASQPANTKKVQKKERDMTATSSDEAGPEASKQGSKEARKQARSEGTSTERDTAGWRWLCFCGQLSLRQPGSEQVNELSSLGLSDFMIRGGSKSKAMMRLAGYRVRLRWVDNWVSTPHRSLGSWWAETYVGLK
jgi:hypothetical protein